jgi:hypothetical protein
MAAALGLLEAAVLSAAMKKQIDVRHLAAIVPLLLFLLIAAASRHSRAATAALVLLAAGWAAADVRLAAMPEYQKEDYRDAVAAAMSIQRKTGAVIAVVADPVGAAYYGMNIEGPAPCYPIRQACRPAFALVPWPRTTAAVEVERWPPSRIDAWLASRKELRTPVLVFAQRDRAHADSAWWPVLAVRGQAAAGRTPVTRVHGFDLEVLN